MARIGPLPLRKIRRNLTHRRLLKSLRDQIRLKGAHAVVVHDVVAAAQTSRATFYNHFSGIDAAVSALLDELWAQTLNLQFPMSEQRSWRSNAIREWLRSVFNIWDDCRMGGLFSCTSL